MSQTNYSRYKYTPDEMSEEKFLARFVVRNEVFNEIFDAIRSADYEITNQHYIIVGQRGQGKTTLLRKLQLEVQKDKNLTQFLLPVKFTEEQYQIRSLCRLWEEVADYLQTVYEDEFGTILDTMEKHFEDDDYDLQCFSYLERALKEKKKKLLLLIDNIDELFGKLKTKEQQQLREILLTSSSFIIVGGSTKMFEQQYEYGKPFYEFFKIVKLRGLNYEESVALLKVIGEDEEKRKIEKVIEETPQRIETLRRLTGGVPRTIIMLFDIFIDEDGNAFEDLLKVLDDVTPLYKYRMDDLPASLQEIVHTIALNWDGMLTKEIAKKTRQESKVISAQLKQLEKYQLVVSESTGKNKIYKIQERFFNIWYLMRFGRKKDRHRVEWLVKFLLSWFSHSELEKKADRFIKSIQVGKVTESYAYHMCEALSYAGLDLTTENTMKKIAKDFLNAKDSKLADELSKTDVEILKEARSLYESENIDDAINILETSNKTSKYILLLLASLYHLQKEYEKAEEYYLIAIDSGYDDALNNLGILYKERKEYEKAKEYYLKAIKRGNTNALFNLGYVYNEQKEYEKAEKYYLKAIDSGYDDAVNNLGNLYNERAEYEKAEEYYLQAIDSGDNDALNSLSWLYFEKGIESEKSLSYAYNSYKNKPTFYNTYILAVVLLWKEEFSKSYDKFLEFLAYDNAVEMEDGIIIYLNLLLSKGQFYKAKELFEMENYQLKERYKPIWYALMKLMEQEFPNEIKKMGSELAQSVDEVLVEIEKLKIKYERP